MELITRQDKGEKLTIQEMDGNLIGLNRDKFQNDKFIELLHQNNIFDEGEGINIKTGAYKIEDAIKADPFSLFDIIDEEDYEALKGPLFNEPRYVICKGDIVEGVGVYEGVLSIIGSIILQGGDILGNGSISRIEEDNEYFEILELGFFKWKYVYGFDENENEHFHYIEFQIPFFGEQFLAFYVELEDDASSWEAVEIESRALSD